MKKNKKMTVLEAFDHLDSAELIMLCMIGAVVALGVFSALSLLTSSPVISSALGLTAGLFVGRHFILRIAQLPPPVKKEP